MPYLLFNRSFFGAEGEEKWKKVEKVEKSIALQLTLRYTIEL